MEGTIASVREPIIELLGEACWQYAYYNFQLDELIQRCDSVYELAEVIQDLILSDLRNGKF